MRQMFILILFMMGFSSAHAKGVQLASCAFEEPMKINDKEIFYIELVGGNFSTGQFDNDDWLYHQVDIVFWGRGLKLLTHSTLDDLQARVSHTMRGNTKQVTIKQKDSHKVIAKATRFGLRIELPFFSTNGKKLSADCEM